jgi:serine/threonine protein kinase
VTTEQLTDYPNALSIGSDLMEYRIEGVLGVGGFGITYLARDTHLDKPVAIKEYFPSGAVSRAR